MTLPIDLFLVRHGQSEGNLAKRRSESGDHEAINRLRERHSSSFRLTQLGRVQAIRAGKWLHSEHRPFDRYFVSEYIRAMETACLLDLPHAEWLSDFYLRERDWGTMDICSEDERQEKWGEELRLRHVEPFFWCPPNGESFADLCLRIDRVLHTMHRECADKRVIAVCHGEVMWAFRVRLERMSQHRFKKLHLSRDSNDRIHNCQIIHYTRRNPESGQLAPYAWWMRMYRPAEMPWDTGWQIIERPKYTNEDLAAIVATVTPVVQ